MNRIISEQQINDIVDYLKGLSFPWKQLEPIALNLYKLPKQENEVQDDDKKQKSANK